MTQLQLDTVGVCPCLREFRGKPYVHVVLRLASHLLQHPTVDDAEPRITGCTAPTIGENRTRLKHHHAVGGDERLQHRRAAFVAYLVTSNTGFVTLHQQNFVGNARS